MRLLVAAAVVLLAAGCAGGDDDPVVRTSPSAAASAASAGPTGAADDPPGSVACTRLAVALSAGSLMVPGVVDGIVQSSRTADAPLADAADRLGIAYRAASAATGNADEPDKIAAVSAAGSDMSGVCADSGLRTAG
ncbi:hypothetical protein GCM10010172_10030 [Paractinoplanes ferrugineus]|uniref:Lipoprotein n=1 Tax=Paractinoplanes ferrugineus TaxID=113564 RepID=A0A919IX51_9ACTN|nr:hypothetical protein [Actinoplanes ferrugineus]GIE09567.1 hypothetical protein Afe05nite_14070 [Actinoplanes ferrugineus]